MPHILAQVGDISRAAIKMSNLNNLLSVLKT